MSTQDELPARNVDKIWPWLTRPSASLRPGLQRQAQLLSLLLALLVLFWLSAGIIPYILRFPGALAHDPFFHMMSVVTIVLAFLYLLSRTRHYTLAAAATVGVTSLSTFAAATVSNQPGKANLLIYLIIPVLLSSILLPLRATIFLAILQLIGVLLYHVWFSSTVLFGTWLAFVLASSMLVLVATYHQTVMEKDRQAELISKHNLLRTVIDHLPDPIYVKDAKHRYLLQNEAVVHMVGANSHAGLEGKTDAHFYPPALAARYQADEQHVIQTGQSLVNQEEPIVDFQGHQRWLLTTKVPLQNADGKIIGVVGIGRDVTNRKQAEDSLALSVKRLDLLHSLEQGVLAGLAVEEITRLALETLCHSVSCHQASVVLFDREAQTAWVLSGMAGEGIVHKQGEQLAMSRFKPPDPGTLHKAILLEDLNTVSEPDPIQEEMQNQGAQAYLSLPLLVESHLLGYLDLGALIPETFNDEYIEIVWEIANQLAMALNHTYLREQLHQYAANLERRVEQRTAELERATDRVETILNNSSDAIVLMTTGGIVGQTNPMFDKLFGYQEEELFGRSLIALVHPDHTGILREALHTVAEKNQIIHLEALAYRKDQSTFYAEIGLSPIRGLHGRCDGIVCNLRDISERKRAEAQLLKALERERELSELRSRFVSMVSHEFRTPLTRILSSSELIEHHLDRMNMEQKRRHFDQIRDSIQYMTQLLDDVLTLGRVETGQIEVHPKALDLEKLYWDILEEIRPNFGPNTQFAYHGTGNCHHVVLDDKLLRQILGNLLSNAAKYSPHGGTVSLELCCDDKAITIRVLDQGIGIPPEDQERLFEPFHRGKNVGNIEGTGLGLAITRRAVTLLGGTICMERSQVGHGTTFTVTLPVTLPGTDRIGAPQDNPV